MLFFAILNCSLYVEFLSIPTPNLPGITILDPEVYEITSLVAKISILLPLILLDSAIAESTIIGFKDEILIRISLIFKPPLFITTSPPTITSLSVKEFSDT